MPQASIHVCLDTNWKPASPLSNWTSSHTLSAAVNTLASSPTSLTISGRRLLARATANEPATGTSTSAVRIGKPAASSCTRGSL